MRTPTRPRYVTKHSKRKEASRERNPNQIRRPYPFGFPQKQYETKPYCAPAPEKKGETEKPISPVSPEFLATRGSEGGKGESTQRKKKKKKKNGSLSP